jgi:uncharacterized protein (DUF2267 family)
MDADEMLSTLAGATGLTRRQADDVLIATLTVMSEVVSTEELRDLVAQLPTSVRQRIPRRGRTVPMRPIEFVARVAELTAATNEDAERNVRAVVQVLTRAVDTGAPPRSVSEHATDKLTDGVAALTYCAVLSMFPALIVLTEVVRLFGLYAETTNVILKSRLGPRSAIQALRRRSPT